MIKKSLITAFSLAACTTAFAESKINFSYMPHAEFDIGTVDFEGDGFGISGKIDVWPGGRIDVDYSVVNHDERSDASGDPDIDIRQTRVGYNFLFGGKGSTLTKNVRLEAAHLSIDSTTLDQSETGFGIHAGLGLQANAAASAFIEVGYVDIDDANGPEVNAGFDYKLSPFFGLFTQYRATMLAVDGDDVDLSEFRVGALVYF